MPKRSLGQHFLKNPSVARAIVAAVAPQRGETIVEVGPGHGELTRMLAEACARSGAKLVAVEKDRELAEELKNNFGEGAAEIVEGDILALLRPPAAIFRSPFKIVGNLPYYLTGHLLRMVGELADAPARCVFMLQKEVAARVMAEAPRMNRLAASVQYFATVTLVARASKNDFSPPPLVDSAVIALDALDRAAEGGPKERYYAAVRTLFAQPRKTVLNNLAARGEKRDLAERLRKLALDPEARPQNLSVAEIAAIARSFF